MSHLIRGESVLAKKKDFVLVGRGEELREISSILMRSRSSSVILNGPAGVGCTSLCLGIVSAKTDPKTPYDIVSKRLFWLDVDGLFSSGDQKKMVDDFRAVMTELERTPESVMVVEDMGDFLAAVKDNGCSHFLNALFSSIKNGHTQVILETHDEDLDETLRCHSDASELLTLMDLEEPTGQDLSAIVKHGVAGLETFHRIRVDETAVSKAVELTSKYRSRVGGPRAQPDSSLTLLDRALSSFRQSIHSSGDSDEIKKTVSKLKEAEALRTSLSEQMREESERIMNSGGSKTASQRLSGSSEALEKLADKIRVVDGEMDKYKKTFDDMAAEVNDRHVLGPGHVISEFSSISGIRVDKLSEDERAKLVGLEDYLKSRIYGQDAALKTVANGIKVSKVGKKTKEAPLSSWLFLGPSGVGKTELAKALAHALLDDEAALTRFDMSEYMEKHAVAKLIGAPPGYEGFSVGGILTNEVRRNPYQVLLFDEIEKAHPDVFNVFLQVLSDGRLTDNVGRVVSFRDTHIIMTTNLGAEELLALEGSPEERRAGAVRMLDANYRAEFLNRFAGRKNIVCFDKLGLDSIEKIVDRELKSIVKSYEEDAVITLDVDVASVAADHYDPKTGARGIPGYLASDLSPKIVDAILEKKQGEVLRLGVNYDVESASMHVEKR